MKNLICAISLLGITTGFLACEKDNEIISADNDLTVAENITLKEACTFEVGMQCYIGILDFPVPASAVKENFDRYTSTSFFWKGIEPTNGDFDFSESDRAIAFAQSAKQQIHAHALIYWESSIIPDYLSNFQGDELEFEAIVKKHIQKIVSRYKGIVHSYDVVNELVDDRFGNNYFNNFLSRYYNSDAEYEDFIGKCFIWANEADPDALLFYNEAKLERADKKRLNATINLVKKLKARGIPIHGVGTQTHTDIYTPIAVIDNMLRELTKTGLKIHISELDVSINEDVTADKTYNFPELTAELTQKQKTAYKNIFYSYKNNVPVAQQFGITMWDLMDHTSWLNQYRKEFPCLYDQDCKKKPAFYGAAIGGLK